MRHVDRKQNRMQQQHRHQPCFDTVGDEGQVRDDAEESDTDHALAGERR
jgi:hypothetical protein